MTPLNRGFYFGHYIGCHGSVVSSLAIHRKFVIDAYYYEYNMTQFQDSRRSEYVHSVANEALQTSSLFKVNFTKKGLSFAKNMIFYAFLKYFHEVSC